MENLRAYFFNNMYLTGIHAGIQAQHCTAEMFSKYDDSMEGYHPLYEWALEYKTTIILNAGYNSNLQRIESELADWKGPYPWASFYESEDALGCPCTSVGIILPEKIYNYNKEKDISLHGFVMEGGVKLSDFDRWLIEELSQCNLMT